jgi:hypothetical protein
MESDGKEILGAQFKNALRKLLDIGRKDAATSNKRTTSVGYSFILCIFNLEANFSVLMQNSNSKDDNALPDPSETLDQAASSERTSKKNKENSSSLHEVNSIRKSPLDFISPAIMSMRHSPNRSRQVKKERVTRYRIAYHMLPQLR